MELVRFVMPAKDDEVRAHLDTMDDDVLKGLSFGVLAKAGGQIVGRILLAERGIEQMYLGELEMLKLKKVEGRKIIGERREAFVQTFSVDEEFRRSGVGTALQGEAVAMCRERKLYQMRGWSSWDKPETYRIKIRLGFGAVPGVQYIERLGKWVPGTYFVMPLHH